MKEVGEVIKIDKNIATVRVNRHAACGDCHACALGMENRQFIDLEVLNTVDAKISDIVELDSETNDVLLAAFIMYGFPLVTMLVGLCLSYYVFAKENTAVAAITAFVCMAVSFIIIRMNESKLKASAKFLPTITSKVNKELQPLIQE